MGQMKMGEIGKRKDLELKIFRNLKIFIKNIKKGMLNWQSCCKMIGFGI